MASSRVRPRRFASSLLFASPLIAVHAAIAETAMELPPLADEIGSAPRGAGGDGAAPAAQGGDMTFFYIVLMILGGLMLFTILTSRKEKKRREALLSGIRKHDRVQTIGGVIGSVVEVKPDTIVLKVDEASNTRMTFARSAVQQILKESPEPRESSEKS